MQCFVINPLQEHTHVRLFSLVPPGQNLPLIGLGIRGLGLAIRLLVVRVRVPVVRVPVVRVPVRVPGLRVPVRLLDLVRLTCLLSMLSSSDPIVIVAISISRSLAVRCSISRFSGFISSTSLLPLRRLDRRVLRVPVECEPVERVPVEREPVERVPVERVPVVRLVPGVLVPVSRVS